ncbi:MAG: hypothetical protein CVU46_10280 [Chloroflexi bacterium HGW-Chloroflexi-8]|nr:MAG: hypothetical protein CVU46_10280 [Chloroflexi bacterium HGW-Chloroflexi-8]
MFIRDSLTQKRGSFRSVFIQSDPEKDTIKANLLLLKKQGWVYINVQDNPGLIYVAKKQSGCVS